MLFVLSLLRLLFVRNSHGCHFDENSWYSTVVVAHDSDQYFLLKDTILLTNHDWVNGNIIDECFCYVDYVHSGKTDEPSKALTCCVY